MSDVLALEKLYDDVLALFAAEGTFNVEQPFGWRRPAEQSATAARIAWVPGDPSGNAGVVGPAKYPGRNPRSLATLKERFYVTISAWDPAEPENERLQYRITRLLRDGWHRAVYLVAHGTFTIESETWIQVRNERRLGSALRVVCTIEAMVPDEAAEAMPIEGSKAVIDVSDQDVTEQLTVNAEDET